MPEHAKPDRDISVSLFNPFPGLRAFEPEEDFLYFGRERQIDELLRRLGESRLLAVVGTSGSGKSSLVRAGLVPALHGGFMTRAGSGWRAAILRPAGDPIGNLAAALDDPSVLGQGGELGEAGRMIVESTLRASSLGLADCVRQSSIPEADNVLVVVDQFEELIRFKHSAGSSRDEAVAFVKLLLAAAGSDAPIYVVLTMRSDFIGDCMEFPGLPEAINRGQYLVPRMTRDELRLAITGPVGVRNARISPRLVSRLLNDVEDNQDQLPVLQHALMRMWGHWEQCADDEVLDLEHYEAIGSLGEALSRHAESIYQQLAGDSDREIAERLFRALTDTDRDGRGIRRPVRVEEVCAIAGAGQSAVVRVIEQFRFQGRSFLMPPPAVELGADSVVDLSHESLMRNWVRLKGWAGEEAESAEIYRRLSQAATLARAGEGGLWRSPELDVGLRWRETERPTAAWARRYHPDFEEAMAFLDRSQKARDDYLARLEEEERQREAIRRRQLRMSQLLTLSLAISFALAMVLFIYFHIQGRRAEQQARLQAVLSARDPLVRALLLAELDNPVGLDWGLEVAQQVAIAAIPKAVLRDPDQVLIGVAFDAEDRQVATVSQEGVVKWWRADGRGEAREGRRLAAASSADPLPELTAVAFSGDGRSLAAGFSDGSLWFGGSGLEAEAGEPRRIAGGPDRTRVRSLAFAPDDRRIVVGSDDYSVAIWSPDAEGWTPLGETEVDRHKGPVSGVAFAADGEAVASASWDGTARVWDLRGGHPTVLGSVSGATALQSVAFSPDGKWVLCASSDGSVLIWRRDGSGEPLELANHESSATNAAFDPDGRRVVISFEDRTAEVWALDQASNGDLEAAGVPTTLAGHRGPLASALFSHSGGELATISSDGSARIWPVQPGEPRIVGRHDKPVESVAFSPDGTRLVSASRDATVRVWGLDGAESPPSQHGGKGYGDWVRRAVFDPGGDRVLAASEDGTFRIWDLTSDAVRLNQEKAAVLGAAFDPSGLRVVTATKDKAAHVWNLAADGEATLAAELVGHESWIWSAAFDATGTRVVTASRDATAKVWTLPRATGEPAEVSAAATFKEHSNQVRSAAFSADGSRVVTASADGTARIWTLGGATGPTILRHEDEVNEASFSSDGAWVVTASKDGTARIWSASLGSERLVLRHAGAVRSAAFSPGSTIGLGEPTFVATGSEDGTVRLWRVSLTSLVDYARTATTACLTVDQRVRLLGESAAQARRQFADCERRYERKPGE